MAITFKYAAMTPCLLATLIAPLAAFFLLCVCVCVCVCTCVCVHVCGETIYIPHKNPNLKYIFMLSYTYSWLPIIP